MNNQEKLMSPKSNYIIESLKLNAVPIFKMIAVYLVIIIGTEAIFRKSLIDTFEWIITSPFLFSLNVFTLLAISSVMLMFTKRIVWVTYVVGILAAILSFVNIGKFALRNVPLLYEDFFLFNEVFILLPQILNPKTIILLVVGVFVGIIIGFALFKFFKNGKLEKHRFSVALLCMLSFIFLLIGQNTNTAGISIQDTGFLYSLSNNTRAAIVLGEEELETADTMYDQYVQQYNEKYPYTPSDVKPNVIVIQSEAFWDINKLGLNMDKNPLKHFEALRDESRYGELYVPVFGGGTSNTEYEILSGMSLKNYSSDWYMVYPNEIKSPTVTLASILRNQGYEALGMHPYMSWYYNRTEVYKHFGFDTFKTLEFMNDVEIIGAYASDRYTTDLIIDAIEETEKPLFNFTVTMQNHGPYGNERFASDAFDVSIKTKLSDSSNYFLKNYVQGIYLSDIELQRLVDYLKQSDEPTILMFYGDHLPMLGEDYQAYRESDFVGDESSEELQTDIRMMGVPYLLWSNFDNTSKELPTMNMSYFTSYILREAGVDMPDYLKALTIAGENLPLYFRTHGVDINGKTIKTDDPLYVNTQALNYLIYTKLKSGEGLDGWAIPSADNKSYNKGITDIKTTLAVVDGSTTVLTGQCYYESMKVTVNGDEVSFKLISDTEIEVKKALKSGDKVEMTLSDTEGKVIAKSETFMMP